MKKYLIAAALIVGFSTLGAFVGGSAKAAVNPAFESNGPYDSQQVDSWITIHADNTATVKLGMVELGQGSPTGLLMVAAEELTGDRGFPSPRASLSAERLHWL